MSCDIEMSHVAGCSRFAFKHGPEFNDRHGRVTLPSLGWVGYRRSRVVGGTPKQPTISAR
jgi:hypothetical protein